MDKIILLILLNILVYYLYKKNIYLLIALFIFMVFYILKMKRNKRNKTIEGNTNYYEYNFWNSLNKDTKVNTKEHNLYNELIKKLNNFLKKYVFYQETPIEQPCIGRFNESSKCSRKCGRGSKYKTYNVIQRKGEGGIDCIYEDGAIHSSECFNRECNEFEDCKDDMDCKGRFYCNPHRKRCEVKDGCDINNLQNCNFIECELLGNNYHYNMVKGCDEYILKATIEKSPKYRQSEDEKLKTCTGTILDDCNKEKHNCEKYYSKKDDYFYQCMDDPNDPNSNKSCVFDYNNNCSEKSSRPSGVCNEIFQQKLDGCDKDDCYKCLNQYKSNNPCFSEDEIDKFCKLTPIDNITDCPSTDICNNNNCALKCKGKDKPTLSNKLCSDIKYSDINKLCEGAGISCKVDCKKVNDENNKAADKTPPPDNTCGVRPKGCKAAKLYTFPDDEHTEYVCENIDVTSIGGSDKCINYYDGNCTPCMPKPGENKCEELKFRIDLAHCGEIT